MEGYPLPLRPPTSILWNSWQLGTLWSVQKQCKTPYCWYSSKYCQNTKWWIILHFIINSTNYTQTNKQKYHTLQILSHIHTQYFFQYFLLLLRISSYRWKTDDLLLRTHLCRTQKSPGIGRNANGSMKSTNFTLAFFHPHSHTPLKQFAKWTLH